jgi:hypothetical protein
MRYVLVEAGDPTPATDIALLIVAVVLMLGGAAMLLFTEVSAGLAIPVIAVGIALTAVEAVRRRSR